MCVKYEIGFVTWQHYPVLPGLSEMNVCIVVEERVSLIAYQAGFRCAKAVKTLKWKLQGLKFRTKCASLNNVSC